MRRNRLIGRFFCGERKKNMVRLKRRSKKTKMSFVQKLWNLLKPFHRDFYFIFVITIAFETIRMGGPYLFGKILDLLIKSNGLLSFQTALFVVGGLVGVRLLSLVIDYFTDYAIINLLWKSEQYVSNTTFNKLLQLSLDYHEKVNTGTKINIVNKGKDKLVDLLGAYAWEFQPIILQLIITAIIMILTSWLIGIIFTLSLVPFFLITINTFYATKKLRSKRHDLYEISSGEIGDTITNISVVKAFAQEQRETTSFLSLWHVVRGIEFKEYKRHVFSSLGKSAAVEIFYVILLLVGIIEIKNGALTVGSLVFLITLIERAYSHVYRLGRIYEQAADASEPVDRISSLMAESQTVKNSPDAVKVDSLQGQISFKHVSFAYKKRKVLKNISFTLRAGSFVAFVGKSGSGKSTIAKLLSRYYDPTSGNIIVDNQYDLKDLDLDVYRRQTAVVFQDSPVPNRRIWEVIAYAAGKRSFASVRLQVEKAAKLAHAHEFIMEMEDGYQTLIGERGVKLSGGQKQRLAIARALFAEPKILIMDEPTSHLDTLSEAQIQQALEDISKQRSLTKIVIAHRLSTVAHADQILVMEKGRLVEHGTHSQLLSQNGVYAEIVKKSELKN